MGKPFKKIGHVVTKSFDTVTGDVLDLDKSKQRDMIRKQREEAQKQEDLRKKREQTEADYQRQVDEARTGIFDSRIDADDTGVGVGDVRIDFSQRLKKKSDKDDLKSLLSKK